MYHPFRLSNVGCITAIECPNETDREKIASPRKHFMNICKKTSLVACLVIFLVTTSCSVSFAAPQESPPAAQAIQSPVAPARELPSNEPGSAAGKDQKPAMQSMEKGSSQKALDWAQWRGPNRTGVLPKQDWPDTLLGKLERKWSIEMGPSYSGPLVVGDHVYSTETVDKKWEVTRCFHRSDGKEVWSSRWEGAMTVPFFAKANGSWIRATPAFDDGRLYVVGIRDMLKCLDAKTGKELWTIDFAKQFNKNIPAFGAVTSPMIDGDFLYTQAASAFFKIKKESGEVVWTTLNSGDNMMSGGSFSSPVIAKINGQRQAIVATRTTLAGVELDKGDVIWEQPIKTYRGMNILTPIVSNNQVFISAYNGSTQMFQIEPGDSKMQPSEMWSNGAKAYMSTPVVVDDHAYMFLQNQRFSCVNLKSGEETYRTSERFGKYASMIVSGKKILALDEDGTLMLLNANPEKFELIDKIKLSGDSWAHLAISGDEIIIRELNALTSYQWKK